MMGNNARTDRRPRAGQVRPRGDTDRPRPPGPEQQRSTAATSGQRPKDQQDIRTMLRSPRFWATLLVLLAINWLLAPLLFPEAQDRITVPYTFFKQQVAAGNVAEITSRGEDIQGQFKRPIADPNSQATTPTAPAGQAPQTYTKFATIQPAFDDPELLPLLEQQGVAITAQPLEQPRSPLLTLLLSFGPTLLLLGGFVWLNSRAASMGGGIFGLGQSRARRYEATTDTERITFDDVAGIDEVKQELAEIVDFLKNSDKYQRLGGRIPKGVLLVGPPGTGKTLLARALAGEALEKIALGAERRLTLQPEERERIAYHESGHALLGLLQPEGDPVRRVTVVPRGQALGVTLSVPQADRYNYGEPYLRARIVNALGGRAAEQVVYGSATTGAENDLKQVSEIARAMVTRWGMSEEVGLLALSGNEDGNFLEQGPVGSATRPYSEETAQAIDQATRRIVDESYTKAIDLLRSNRERLDALAHALLREESLDKEQVREATGLSKRPAVESAIAAHG